jgi:tryptophan synthase alpha chain|tara:strand:- start:1139 stop:1933 length:795 start_codon:yes stop_codon:yes gene_type:complete
MNRIEERFRRLKEKGQKGFVVYIGAGDPNLDATHDLALAFDDIGVDVLELGVPFSDPLADGLVNQLAAQRGLDSGTTMTNVLETVTKIREKSKMPIVLYVYFNLLHKRGLQKFVLDAAKAGVDGLLVLDLPPEESEDYEQLMAEVDMCPIYLVAPTTPPDRVGLIVKRGKGFIYYVSREGVTGMQRTVSNTVGEMTAIIRQNTDVPIAVGFGISNPEQAAQVAQNSDAVVVGSAIVNQIAEKGQSMELVSHVKAFTAELITGIR